MRDIEFAPLRRIIYENQVEIERLTADLVRMTKNEDLQMHRAIRAEARNAELTAALRGVIEWWDADGPHRAEPDFVTEARRALEGMK